MAIKTDGYLTTKELLDYVKTQHKRHWSRFYLYKLIKKNEFSMEKVGHINLYKKKAIDIYISNLKRPSSSGKRGKSYEMSVV